MLIIISLKSNLIYDNYLFWIYISEYLSILNILAMIY